MNVCETPIFYFYFFNLRSDNNDEVHEMSIKQKSTSRHPAQGVIFKSRELQLNFETHFLETANDKK